MIIHTEEPSQTKTIKAILKALNVKVEMLPNQSSANELPKHISNLMKKSIKEADNKQLTPHNDFMQIIKNQYAK